MEHLAKPETRAARLAAKVAERYANAPSYSEVLAAEARAAARAAEAAALAARQVCAAVEAFETARAQDEAQGEFEDEFEDEIEAGPQDEREAPSLGATSNARLPGYINSSQADYTVSSRVADPRERASVSPAEPLPVNLIEFPRELVATRKARPRLAEGPLRESLDEFSHDQSQLRIFEVEPESISKAVEIDAPAPEWSSIRLDAQPASDPLSAEAASLSQGLPDAAPLEDRVMAGIVDIALVLFAFVLFVFVVAASTDHPPTGRPALTGAGLVLAGLFLLYQYLFFRFANGTPGMRYAKIALCTFDQDNPTRAAMRRRILYLLLSAAPFGMGFAWAWFDGQRLGWHDRLSRMYQRSYRS